MKNITIGLIIFVILKGSSITISAQTSNWKIKNIAAQNEYVIEITIKGNKFHAQTRNKLIKNAIGATKYNLGRLAGKIKQNRLVIMNGDITTKGDTLIVNGKYSSVNSTQNLNLKIFNNTLEGYISPKPDVKNLLSGRRIDDITPDINYIKMLDSIFSISEKHIYDKSILGQRKFQQFKKQMYKTAKKINDNWDMETSFNYAAYTKLPFTHYGLDYYNNLPNKNSKTRKYVFLTEPKPCTALLTIKQFSGPAAEMDSIVNILKEKNYKNLIIDLRNNGGGTIIKAISLIKYLVKEETYGGVFLTNKWFAKNNNPPDTKDYGKLNVIEDNNFEIVFGYFGDIDPHSGHTDPPRDFSKFKIST